MEERQLMLLYHRLLARQHKKQNKKVFRSKRSGSQQKGLLRVFCCSSLVPVIIAVGGSIKSQRILGRAATVRAACKLIGAETEWRGRAARSPGRTQGYFTLICHKPTHLLIIKGDVWDYAESSVQKQDRIILIFRPSPFRQKNCPLAIRSLFQGKVILQKGPKTPFTRSTLAQLEVGWKAFVGELASGPQKLLTVHTYYEARQMLAKVSRVQIGWNIVITLRLQGSFRLLLSQQGAT